MNHGGFINVYSEPGKGTTFNFYLPATKQAGVSGQVLEDEKAVMGKGTILLVDDEEIIIEVGEKMLENLGYKVLLARGGNEAIEIYKRNQDKIDLVILDMIMPDIGGEETFDELRKISPEVKVILASGYSIDGQATEIMSRGCNGFMQKPYNMKGLSQKIWQVLAPHLDKFL